MTLDIEKMERFASYQVEAKLKRYVMSRKISRPWNEEDSFVVPPIHVRIDRWCDEAVVHFVHDVYALDEVERVIELDVSFTVPDTWVDALRQRIDPWLPSWIAKHWTPHTRVLRGHKSVTVTAIALLPGIPPKLGEHRVHFALQGLK